MILRRITQHLREQNWFAVFLELLVVIVGIFLAFQVERWYEDQRLKSSEGHNLIALLGDFAEDRKDLDWMIERYDSARTAARTLIQLERADAASIDNDKFYQLIADSQRQANLEPRRQTYDYLVATGAIESLGDESLKSELGAHFAFVDRFRGGRARWDSELSFIWENFVQHRLDRNMLIRHAHPNDPDLFEPKHPPDRFRELVGSDELVNVLGKRWHFYRDRAAGLRQLRDSNIRLEQLITENLEQVHGTDL